jgi:hypothetical protein
MAVAEEEEGCMSKIKVSKSTGYLWISALMSGLFCVPLAFVLDSTFSPELLTFMFGTETVSAGKAFLFLYLVLFFYASSVCVVGLNK